jgi:hypothetical protein
MLGSGTAVIGGRELETARLHEIGLKKQRMKSPAMEDHAGEEKVRTGTARG